jgi:hypothetical protein
MPELVLGEAPLALDVPELNPDWPLDPSPEPAEPVDDPVEEPLLRPLLLPDVPPADEDDEGELPDVEYWPDWLDRFAPVLEAALDPIPGALPDEPLVALGLFTPLEDCPERPGWELLEPVEDCPLLPLEYWLCPDWLDWPEPCALEDWLWPLWLWPSDPLELLDCPGWLAEELCDCCPCRCLFCSSCEDADEVVVL